VSGKRGDHVTGSGPSGYLDPELILKLSPAEHDEVHRLSRAAAIDDPVSLLPGPPPVALTELRLRRLAIRLDVVGERVGGALGAFLVALSGAIENWANELADWLTGETP
jgi:hypothetical protein